MQTGVLQEHQKITTSIKTEEIMELQVDSANSRFKLELALRLYELKNMV